jgi:hypothetical protein
MRIGANLVVALKNTSTPMIKGTYADLARIYGGSVTSILHDL